MQFLKLANVNCYKTQKLSIKEKKYENKKNVLKNKNLWKNMRMSK